MEVKAHSRIAYTSGFVGFKCNSAEPVGNDLSLIVQDDKRPNMEGNCNATSEKILQPQDKTLHITD
jgi:hypothetical protein